MDREQRHQEERERERLTPADADEKREAELDPDLKDLEAGEPEQAAIKGGPLRPT